MDHPLALIIRASGEVMTGDQRVQEARKQFEYAYRKLSEYAHSSDPKAVSLAIRYESARNALLLALLDHQSDGASNTTDQR